MILREPLAELFTKSVAMILDFAQLSSDMPDHANIQQFFETASAANKNPRLPELRQTFNDTLLDKAQSRYLIGRYGEDRRAMLADTPAGKQGRTIHMAIDIFAKNLEPVFAPCDGKIVRSDYEAGFGEFGNYIIFQPSGADFYIFFGHLSYDKKDIGKVKAGDVIAHLGDHTNNENGGWSRHLHVQILRELPPAGKTPIGYSTRATFVKNAQLFPDPLRYFTEWKLNES